VRIPRIFFDDSLTVGVNFELSRDQAHYLGRVLRLTSGRPILVFNGRGGEFACEILELDGKRGLIRVIEHLEKDTESPLSVCLAIGLSKGDRFDWLLQKATELGVSSIQPLFTERTEVRLSAERLGKKHAHWQSVIQSACEQSGRTKVPAVFQPTDLSSHCEITSSSAKLILDPSASLSIAKFDFQEPESSADLLVGPEGGLSSGEIDVANANG
ncbi:UNVERIFIED_CONTAM: hypothetical protein GTU68_010497, partial [Idotea baltica]|nr:hypothetical protein [Idotea baltica]